MIAPNLPKFSPTKILYHTVLNLILCGMLNKYTALCSVFMLNKYTALCSCMIIYMFSIEVKPL